MKQDSKSTSSKVETGSWNWDRLEKLKSKLKTEIETEIEVDWKLKSRSKLRSNLKTEIETEIEVDWKLKPRSKWKPKLKTCSETHCRLVDVKKSNQFWWNIWGEKSNHFWGNIWREKKQPKDETRELIKEKKEVTSKTAFCTSQKKWRYIFCRKSFFATKHKILKRQKKVKKKATTEAASFDETYHMKKSNQFWGNIWGEKGKKK